MKKTKRHTGDSLDWIILSNIPIFRMTDWKGGNPATPDQEKPIIF
ncbi:hypothetical protein [Psychroflexus tropicus]|nr:hypothetical protein [Psychroflexus tropicus]